MTTHWPIRELKVWKHSTDSVVPVGRWTSRLQVPNMCDGDDDDDDDEHYVSYKHTVTKDIR